MSREVRRVRIDWKHPMGERGRLKPLHEGYVKDAEAFMEKARVEGLQEALDYFGEAPNRDNYMPEWPDAERTHLMMYETCSEGTPISPAFATPEELAWWLTDNGASAFGTMTATYEQWLATANLGWAPSMIISDGRARSGVKFSK